MDSTSDLQGNQPLAGITAAGEVKQRNAQARRNVAITLWIIGFIALVAASVIVRFHPAPWPFDLQTTNTLQHLQLSSWVSTPIAWVSIVEDPINSTLALLSGFALLTLIGDFVWYRGGSPWHYRWILIPFQLYAILNILLIGFSRVYEGSHWLTDALGGYLSGALFLVLLIVLYRWTLDMLPKRRARRLAEKPVQAQQA